MNKQRIQWVDVLKGIAIIFVVIGHNSDSGIHLRFHWIYIFHMPLFFFLAGYVYPTKEIRFKEFVQKKFRTLIVPYIVFSGIAIWLYCTFREVSLQVLKTFWFANRAEMGGGTPYDTSLWFLPCLFLMNLLYFALSEVIKNDRVKFAIITALSIGGFFIVRMNYIFPLSLDSALYYLVFFAAGNLLREKQNSGSLLNKKGKIMLLVTTVLNLLPIVPAVKPYFDGSNYLLQVVAAFAGTYLFCQIAQFFCRFECVKNFFTYWGKNSLTILALHTLTRDYGVSPIIWGITGQFYSTEWVRWVYIIGSLILCIPFCEAINKCFPFVIGKQDKHLMP